MNNKLNVTPVILCGGFGTRLWPMSRKGFPKQFMELAESLSLFQQTINRLTHIETSNIQLGETLVVTNEEHRFLALDQIKEISDAPTSLLLEPAGRNTAPALTFAAFQATSNECDPILLVAPADHIVKDDLAFKLAIQNAIRVAANNVIVVLGIKPTGPETGFGYIRHQGIVGKNEEYSVAEFIEKPDLNAAEAFFSSGNYSWNSGIFVLRASIWLKAIKYFRLDIFQATAKAFASANQESLFIRPDEKLFTQIPIESIDFAVMEHCPNSIFPIKMISLNAGWSDLGAWNKLWQIGERDSFGNVLKGDVLALDTQDSLIFANHRLVNTLGVKDLVVIETADVVFVADRSQSQNVKMITNTLNSQKREELMLHRKVIRPWGWYDTLDVGENFKVKRIQVNPGASLSLQSHSKRAEHWVVVKGIANVIRGETSITLRANESTYIPLGEPHRLSNPTHEILEIIEVQSGEYLGEDDIIRYEDSYDRMKKVVKK